MNIFEYSIPFSKLFTTANDIYKHRKGLILKTETSYGPVYAEAAPLPGFSSNTLQESKDWLSLNWEQTEKEHKKMGSHFWNQVPTPSSLAFALDALHWIYLSTESKQSLSGLLFTHTEANASAQVHVNRTISMADRDITDILKYIDKAKKRGFKTFKFKVGIDADRELTMINHIREVYPDIGLRLDANRAFSYSDAVTFTQNLESAQIEYIEEPLREDHLSSISELYKQTSIELAADESTHSLPDALSLCKSKWFDVLVLKPMLLGSFANIFKVVEKASLNGKKLVFSSALETAIGRIISAHLSVCVTNSNDVAHGLATGEWLKHDFISESAYLKNGAIPLSDSPGLGYQIDEAALGKGNLTSLKL